LIRLYGSDPKKAIWDLGKTLLRERGGIDERKAGGIVGKWFRDHKPDVVWGALQAAWRAETREPVPYVAAAISKAEDEAANPSLFPPEWMQRKWMEDFREGTFGWSPQRGPEPGEEGCRVSPAIQREFGVEPARPRAVEA
jgi:hypothetical protein